MTHTCNNWTQQHFLLLWLCVIKLLQLYISPQEEDIHKVVYLVGSAHIHNCTTWSPMIHKSLTHKQEWSTSWMATRRTLLKPFISSPDSQFLYGWNQWTDLCMCVSFKCGVLFLVSSQIVHVELQMAFKLSICMLTYSPKSNGGNNLLYLHRLEFVNSTYTNHPSLLPSVTLYSPQPPQASRYSGTPVPISLVRQWSDIMVASSTTVPSLRMGS